MELFDFNPYQMRILIEKFEYFIFERFFQNQLGLDFRCVSNKFHFRILFLDQALIIDFAHQKRGFCRDTTFIHALLMPKAITTESPKKGLKSQGFGSW